MKRRRKPQLNYKKQEKKRKKSCIRLRELVKEFSGDSWMHLIAEMDINEQRGDPSNYIKAEMFTLVMDLALRLSSLNVSIGSQKPTYRHYRDVLSLYFECDQTPSKLIKELGIIAIPLAFAWQNKLIYPNINILGRLHLLYADYEEDILEAIGMSAIDMHIIVLAIMAVREQRRSAIIMPSMLITPKIESLNEETVKRFFEFFAVNQSEYHTVAKTHKVYDNTVGRFNLVNRYPIIELSNGNYIVPVLEQLFDSVAANLYYHILAHKFHKNSKESRRYLDEFGMVMENYVLDLTRHAFGDKNVISADSIVTKSSDDRCEVVAFHSDRALAIEVKKLNFKRDTIVDIDIKDIDDKLINQVGKAIEQLSTTLGYVKEKEKYGLVVLPDVVTSPSVFSDYVSQDGSGEGFTIDNNILLCTLSSYESLMANNPDVIFEALQITASQSKMEGRDIGLVLQQMQDTNEHVHFTHPLSNEVFEKKIRAQEANMRQNLIDPPC